MHMKNIFEKHKMLIISSSMLLSTIISFSIINSNFFKQITIVDESDLNVGHISEVIENEKEADKSNESNGDVDENYEKNNQKKESINSLYSEETKDKNEIENNEEVKNNIKTEKNTNSNENKGTDNFSNPITGEKYTVKSGDTLFLISQRANVSVNHLKQLNNLSSDIIQENQTLQIKGEGASFSNQVASRGGQRDEDHYWLSRVISAEAEGESYEGKVAVGNVILNRVSSPKFPNTIKGVVFDKQDGYTQFSPVLDGSIYNNPDPDSVKAATDVLNGLRLVENALYFLNPRKSTNFWIVENRQYMKTIGLHDFYY